MILQEEALLEIIGGANISGTLINAFVRGLNAFLDLGRSLGTAIRRVIGGKSCPI